MSVAMMHRTATTATCSGAEKIPICARVNAIHPFSSAPIRAYSNQRSIGSLARQATGNARAINAPVSMSARTMRIRIAGAIIVTGN